MDSFKKLSILNHFIIKSSKIKTWRFGDDMPPLSNVKLLCIVSSGTLHKERNKNKNEMELSKRDASNKEIEINSEYSRRLHSSETVHLIMYILSFNSISFLF